MSRFRTTEISDPQFESDNLRFITVKTEHLKGRGDLCVFVPEGVSAANLPLVVLLHGVYGSAWIWAHKAGVHRTAQRLIEAGRIKPMVIAMPSDGLWGDGSAYLPHNALNFEKWDDYKLTKKIGLLDKIGEMVGEGKMPPAKFLERKPESKPSEKQKELVLHWAEKESTDLMEGN